MPYKLIYLATPTCWRGGQIEGKGLEARGGGRGGGRGKREGVSENGEERGEGGRGGKGEEGGCVRERRGEGRRREGRSFSVATRQDAGCTSIRTDTYMSLYVIIYFFFSSLLLLHLHLQARLGFSRSVPPSLPPSLPSFPSSLPSLPSSSSFLLTPSSPRNEGREGGGGRGG